jgi:hypothetical protein
MISHEDSLRSEVRELESILQQIPVEDVIDRLSFESRLIAAQKELDQLPAMPVSEKARLTFRGRPVFGSRGVAADFGSKATTAFSDAFSAVVAGLNESLRYMGPIPDKARNQLLITGTAIGSFGFEFELPEHAPDLFPDQGRGSEALEKMQTLFQLSAMGSDDEVAELVEEIHPRAVKKIAEFLGYLVQQQAWCGLEFRHKFFRFEDIEQLQISAARLQESNIREGREQFVGEFQGVLPHSRAFEFKLLDQQGLIKGKVAPAIEEPDVLNREFLHKLATITVDVFQVGQGRPHFSLRNLNDIELPRTVQS